MQRKTQWQVAALVVLAILWLGWRWAGFREQYDSRTFTAGEPGDFVSDADEEIPAWTGLPDWPEAEPGQDTDFVHARLERERARSLIIEVLADIAADHRTDESMRREAQHRLIALAEAAAAEREVEQLLKSQGWGSVMCYAYPGSAIVVTAASEVSPGDAARIMDVVATVTGLGWDAITVIATGGD